MTGSQPTAADFAAFPCLQIGLAGELTEMAELIRARPTLMRWMSRMEEFNQ